jgi:phosphoglycolate phosphatase-like HAD superfamily hydrolase
MVTIKGLVIGLKDSTKLNKVCLLSDMEGIWFKIDHSYFDLINRKLGVDGNKARIFSKILEKRKKLARIGKLSTFSMGALPYKFIGYEDLVFKRASFTEMEINNAKKIYILLPFAKKVLGEISKNALLIGISDSPLNGDRMRRILEKIGILKYFHYIFTSHDLGCEKPKAFKFFVHLKENYDIYFLGHDDDEIIGAKKFGFETIGLKNEKADIKISSLAELLKIFD